MTAEEVLRTLAGQGLGHPIVQGQEHFYGLACAPGGSAADVNSADSPFLGRRLFADLKVARDDAGQASCSARGVIGGPPPPPPPGPMVTAPASTGKDRSPTAKSRLHIWPE